MNDWFDKYLQNGSRACPICGDPNTSTPCTHFVVGFGPFPIIGSGLHLVDPSRVPEALVNACAAPDSHLGW